MLARKVPMQAPVRSVSQENTRLIAATRCVQIAWQISTLQRRVQQVKCAKRVLRIRNRQPEVVLKRVVNAMLALRVLMEARVCSVLRENTR